MVQASSILNRCRSGLPNNPRCRPVPPCAWYFAPLFYKRSLANISRKPLQICLTPKHPSDSTKNLLFSPPFQPPPHCRVLHDPLLATATANCRGPVGLAACDASLMRRWGNGPPRPPEGETQAGARAELNGERGQVAKLLCVDEACAYGSPRYH